MRQWIVIAMVVVGAGFGAACGGDNEVRDRPEDCRSDQYFDEGREQCRTCPAVDEPQCLPGCGFEVDEDSRQCPILRCDATCPGCDEGESWNREQERCEPL